MHYFFIISGAFFGLILAAFCFAAGLIFIYKKYLIFFYVYGIIKISLQ